MHGRNSLIAAFVLLFLSAPTGLAQDLSNESSKRKVDGQNVPKLTLQLADQQAFLDRHGSKVGLHARNIRSIAAPDFPEQDILGAGTWQEVPGSGHIWRLAIQSSGAQSHVLIFSKVFLPEGSSLRIKSQDEDVLGGVCGHNCQQYSAQDINVSGRLVVPEIQGETIIIEYVQPSAPLDSGWPLLRLASVLQGFKESLAEVAQSSRRRARRLTALPPMPAQPARQAPAADPGAALGPAPPQQAQGTQFNVDQMQMTSDGVSQCTASVECAPAWAEEASGVMDIYAIDMRLGAMGLCTGTIINAPLGKKFLLTADHCFVDKVDISNFQWWLLIFNYETPCRSKDRPPPIRQVIQGTKLLFYDSKSDVLLLDIPNAIPDNFKAYKVGFDAEEVTPQRAISIHHPAGNIKRISYANSTDSITTNFQAPTFSEDIHPTNQTHFQVKWTQGATQGGSSGAALIDADSRKVVGILTGGTTTCDIFSGADYFGMLSVAWRNGLQNFLSDAPSLTDSGQGGLSTVTQYAGGVVVVDALEGTPLPHHGPAINFWPSVFVMGPENVTRVAFYLTDSPAPNEVIQTTIVVKGDLPGNQINPAPYITLSEYSFNFTTDNCCQLAQPLAVTTALGASVPGDLLRLQIVFWLTSSTNASYLHVSTMKGIIQSGFTSWTTLQPVACLKAPCYFTDPILATAPPTYPLPTKAVFRYAPTSETAVAQDVCLQDGFLDLATISVYINGTFTWTLSQSFDNSECVHIPALEVPAGIALYTVVSDADDYEAVLPIGAVKSVAIRETAPPPAVAQNRPTAAAEIVAAVNAAWQRDTSAPPPAVPPATTARAGPHGAAAGGGNVPSAAPGPGIAAAGAAGSAVQPAAGSNAAAQPAGGAQDKAVTASSTSGTNPFGGEKGGQAEAARASSGAPPASPQGKSGAGDYMDGASAAVIAMPSASLNSNGR